MNNKTGRNFWDFLSENSEGIGLLIFFVLALAAILGSAYLGYLSEIHK